MTIPSFPYFLVPSYLPNIELTPFHSDTRGTFYTSATARKTLTFGYTYPEVVDWGVSAAQLSANVRVAINKLYNPKGTISTSKRSRIARGMNIKERGIVNTNDVGYQWAINLRSDTYVLPSSPAFHLLVSNEVLIIRIMAIDLKSPALSSSTST